MQEWKNHIEANPDIIYGKPVISGTPNPVDMILEKMSYGQTPKEIIRDYPDLKEKDILSCLAYVILLMRNELNLPPYNKKEHSTD